MPPVTVQCGWSDCSDVAVDLYLRDVWFSSWLGYQLSWLVSGFLQSLHVNPGIVQGSVGPGILTGHFFLEDEDIVLPWNVGIQLPIDAVPYARPESSFSCFKNLRTRVIFIYCWWYKNRCDLGRDRFGPCTDVFLVWHWRI